MNNVVVNDAEVKLSQRWEDGNFPPLLGSNLGKQAELGYVYTPKHPINQVCGLDFWRLLSW